MRINMKLLFLLSGLQQWSNLCVYGASLSFDANEWQTVSPNVAFKRNNDRTSMESSAMRRAADNAISRMLSSKDLNPSYMYQNLDSSVEYDEYQLAWHLLGYYVDCSATNSYGSGCPRQVLYAAYANPNYEGGGIGEYTYYNKKTKKYACYGSGSCKTKMDCHLPSTQWKLLGLFKIDNVSQRDGWMEQLFKHEGVCVWGWDTYSFASAMRQNMPTSCTATTQKLKNGSTLYYSTKPDLYGGITLGLYTDSMCSIEYVGHESYNVFKLSGADESQWSSFNEALDVYKQCQPCISYDLSNDGFNCYDDAGYTNCNQCMKFSNKAGCKIATQNDVVLASRQGGLISTSKAYGANPGSGKMAQLLPTTIHSPMQNFPSLSASILFCFLGVAAFFSTLRRKTYKGGYYRSGSSRTVASPTPSSPRRVSGNRDSLKIDAYALYAEESPRSKKKSSSGKKARSQSLPNRGKNDLLMGDAFSDALCGDPSNVFGTRGNYASNRPYYSSSKPPKSPKRAKVGRLFS